MIKIFSNQKMEDLINDVNSYLQSNPDKGLRLLDFSHGFSNKDPYLLNFEITARGTEGTLYNLSLVSGKAANILKFEANLNAMLLSGWSIIKIISPGIYAILGAFGAGLVQQPVADTRNILAATPKLSEAGISNATPSFTQDVSPSSAMSRGNNFNNPPQNALGKMGQEGLVGGSFGGLSSQSFGVQQSEPANELTKEEQIAQMVDSTNKRDTRDKETINFVNRYNKVKVQYFEANDSNNYEDVLIYGNLIIEICLDILAHLLIGVDDFENDFEANLSILENRVGRDLLNKALYDKFKKIQGVFSPDHPQTTKQDAEEFAKFFNITMQNFIAVFAKLNLKITFEKKRSNISDEEFEMLGKRAEAIKNVIEKLDEKLNSGALTQEEISSTQSKKDKYMQMLDDINAQLSS